MIKDILQKLFTKSLKKAGIDSADVSFEHPQDLSHGDYATNVAMRYAKDLGKNPRELAEDVVSGLDSHEFVEKYEVAGPGFVNIFLSKTFLKNSIADIQEKDSEFGSNEIGLDKVAIVEYSSPNIAKPFSIGHFRSTIIGDVISNIMEKSSYEVVRDNHLGDWGTQFGKLIVAIKKWGDMEKISESENPVKELVALYVKFHKEAEEDESLNDEGREWFTKLENGNEEARDLWKRCITWSMTEFDRIYKRLGVKFDTMIGESFFEDKMDVVVEDLKSKDLLKESEGASLVFFDDEKMPPAMILKKDGSTLYATRDLATDLYRKKEYNPDVVVNEVGSEQSLYFRQIFEIEEMLGYFNKDQRIHVSHGLYRFADGKMATRKGNVIWLNDVLDQAVEKVKEAGADDNIAEDVGVGALIFNDLKRESSKFINFDWGEILNITGDSGPYVQYTHARCVSLLEKGKTENFEPNLDGYENYESSNLEKLLYRYPEFIEISLTRFEAHHIPNYLLELCREFNSWYAANKVIDTGDKDTSEHRLAIVNAVRVVVRNGLNILGIEAPEKM